MAAQVFVGALRRAMPSIMSPAAVPAGSFSVSGHAVDIGMKSSVRFHRRDSGRWDRRRHVQGHGKGTTWQVARDSLTMTAHLEDASSLISTPQSARRHPARIFTKVICPWPARPPCELVLAGRDGQRPFRVRATTGSLSEFLSNRPRPDPGPSARRPGQFDRRWS